MARNLVSASHPLGGNKFVRRKPWSDIRSNQRFSRHKDLRLLQRYDDNRQDLGGAVARRLAEDA